MQKSKWAKAAFEPSKLEINQTPYVPASEFANLAVAEDENLDANASEKQVQRSNDNTHSKGKGARNRNRNRNRKPHADNQSLNGNSVKQTPKSTHGSHPNNGNTKFEGAKNNNRNNKPDPNANRQPNGGDNKHQHGGKLHNGNERQANVVNQQKIPVPDAAPETISAPDTEQQEPPSVPKDVPKADPANEQDASALEAKFRFPPRESIPWDVYKQLALNFQGRELTPNEWQLAVEAAEVAIETAGHRPRVVMASRWDWADEVAAEAEEEL
jgi:hypothetical protein